MIEKKIKPKVFKDIKQENGITLIALVITIIVLLILAGVALATLSGNNNIIENANEAVGKYNNSVNEEKATMGDIENLFEKYVTGEENPPAPVEPPEVDEDGLAKENVTIKPDENSNVQIVIPTGFAPAILATGTTQSGPGEDGSVKEIMPAEEWNNITVEDINKGIVIVDHAITYDNGQPSGTVPDFNEYVWVSIPGSSKFARVEWNGPYYDTEYHSIGTHPLAEESTTNKYWDDKTTTEYQNMVASVEHYKGFYIGRYEASQGSGDIAQSKRNQTTWTNVAQTTAKTACTNNTTANMHLMYGIEWDSALNWLIGKAKISSSTSGVTKTMEIGDVQTNSSSWGNYNNSTGDAATNSGGDNRQTAGYSEYWKANNIYDLAGNVWEWTQENYSTGTYRARRGGSCYYGGGYNPVAVRSYNDEGYTYDGLRVPWQLFCSTGLW